jgi:pimeloyl-ACP methyl ester carboxylesterase
MLLAPALPGYRVKNTNRGNMPYSTRNGLRIHYEVHGDGPPMVLIHANPFDRRLWLYQIARFSAFYRVIAVDLRGYGHSDKPEASFTLADMLDDVLGVCADEGVTRAIFAGVSVGSGIALLASITRPDMVAAAILVGGSSAGPRDVNAILAGFEGKPLGEHLMHLMRGYVAPGFADTPLGDYLLNLFVENSATLSVACIANIFRARASCNMTESLGGVHLPVLVVNGAFDGSLPAGRRTASMLPNAEHVVIDDAGHACCLEKPQAFDAAIIAFFVRNGLAESGLSHVRGSQS